MSAERPPDPPPGAPPPADSAPSYEALAERLAALSRENRSLFEQALAGERKLRGLARSVWRVQEDERRRLAGELHDDLGQLLTALKIHLELTRSRILSTLPEGGEDLDRSIELASEALGKVRHLSRVLRPKLLDDLGLAAGLTWLARSLGEWTGFEVEVRAEGLDERLPPDIETLAFRVVQEALNNALKHSGAPGAEVRAVVRGRRLALSVADAGRGFDPSAIAPEQGCGLANLRDRARIFGGRCRILSAPGEGTRVEIELPIESVEPP